MALATKEDVEARLRRDLTAGEELSIDDDLEDASAVVIGYCGQDFEPSPYPLAVVGVVAKMVARSYSRTAGSAGGFAQEQTAGPFGVKYSSDSSVGDSWLTKGDKYALRPYRLGGGMTSVQLVGERYNIVEDDES